MMARINLDDELNHTLLSFSDIQAELNLRHARDAMQEVVEHLDLTPEERSGLEAELGGLNQMLNKLEQTRVQIAVFGMVGR
jgi:GTP-binding protein Era